MILEVAILNIKIGMSNKFEIAFFEAAKIISSIPGYISHDLQKCVEVSDRYLLLLYWQIYTIALLRESESFRIVIKDISCIKIHGSDRNSQGI